MKYKTCRFGEVEVEESQIYLFPEGIPGFADLCRFFIIRDPRIEPFLVLQSAECAEIAFMVVNPLVFFSEYTVNVSEEDLASIKLKDISEGLVLVVLTIQRDFKKTTANLLAPIILNPKELLGKQVILNNSPYTTRHSIFDREDM